MDEFGVLVESIGFKSQGKSAPMALLKSKPQSNLGFTSGFPQNIGAPSKNDFFVDDLDGIFRSHNNSSNKDTGFTHNTNFLDDSNDIFGGGSSISKRTAEKQGVVDLDSVFAFSNSSYEANMNSNDDLLTSMPRKSDSVDDLLGNFEPKQDFSRRVVEENGFGSDDLIPGFGESSLSSNKSPSNGERSNFNFFDSPSGDASKSSSSLVDDPFLVFESSKPLEDASPWPFSEPLQQNNKNISVQSSTIKLKNFGTSKIQEESLNQKQDEKSKERTVGVTKMKQETIVKESNLEEIFGMGTRASNINRPISKTKDPIFDALFKDVESEFVKTFPEPQKPSSSTSFSNDFSSLFEDDGNSSGEFKEVEGESDERRRIRFNNHMRTQGRMAKALAEKKQRDLQALRDQEERLRLGESMDSKIKHWSAGKESNLRALLSSLQDVLWPECGWQPVLLPDLITSTAVKKAYYRATLCLHPDKVQQKGSSPQKKYIAEKVFHVLKEAWKKFNAEELK